MKSINSTSLKPLSHKTFIFFFNITLTIQTKSRGYALKEIKKKRLLVKIINYLSLRRFELLQIPHQEIILTIKLKAFISISLLKNLG